MERLDIHVALELCEIVIESATIVAILKSDPKEKDRFGESPKPGRRGDCSPEFAAFKIDGVFPSEYFVPVTELDEANDVLKLKRLQRLIRRLFTNKSG
jgi:hypothetical protein